MNMHLTGETLDPATIEPTGLWARLKAGTRADHERLDKRISEGRPFETVERYGRFLLVQHDFHGCVSRFYQNAELAALLPDLANRDRLPAIEADLHDLGLAAPASALPAHVDTSDLHAGIGWLYVAEGSNLGAAFLLKWAKQIGLSEDFGARHLAAAPEGRGLHWKTFTTALDAIPLSAEQEARVIAGANAAFRQVAEFTEKRLFEEVAG